jgi:enhancing lycopene biosynthesis protein 2
METKPKVAVILSGCGVYDGAEIHESVLSLLEIETQGGSYQIFAPNIEQYHVINHLTGEEMNEKRNVLVEAARIARGKILPLNELNVDEFDAMLMPGGFGVAKNLSTWAFSGPQSNILMDLKDVIVTFHKKGKPIGALCISPTTIAKALENEKVNPTLTVGTTASASPYDISSISKGIESLGAKHEPCDVNGIVIDAKNKIVTSPCYMMETSLFNVHQGIKRTVEALLGLINQTKN